MEGPVPGPSTLKSESTTPAVGLDARPSAGKSSTTKEASISGEIHMSSEWTASLIANSKESKLKLESTASPHESSSIKEAVNTRELSMPSG